MSPLGRPGGATSWYTSSNVSPGSVGSTVETGDDAEARLGKYETDTVVTAYVLPEEPGRAYLEPKRTGAPLPLMGMGGLFTVVGLGSLLRSSLGG
ncbi:hypothetical protein [Haloarchaeobius iranensis]|uniref:DUF3592 domain-containing protein n=1 Tax=Haloarchaeobius iranensis TaxID=996166 RepID=A0A1G9ZAZ7_9EURY|nr:hypothetical protein [Haloarchaeobius iranensis]SDN18519.1 hypothetical protein SAMN05192554_11930 [Haloarchaeobius iranensis]